MTGVITDASSSARAEMSAWASRAVAGEADEQQLRQLGARAQQRSKVMRGQRLGSQALPRGVEKRRRGRQLARPCGDRECRREYRG
jgi:hypothetical protein